MSTTKQIEQRIAEAVAASGTGCELLLVETAGRGTLRVFIDHPEGVTLSHCEAITRELEDLRDRWSLEVSSPGPERPLTRPEHFVRYVGRKARLRLVEPVSPDDRRTLSGEIVDADASGLVLLAEGERIEVGYPAIGRANLIAA